MDTKQTLDIYSKTKVHSQSTSLKTVSTSMKESSYNGKAAIFLHEETLKN